MHWINQQARDIRATLKYRKRVARARERLVWWYGVDSRFGGDQDEGSNMPDVIDWIRPFVYRSRGGWLMHTCMKALVVILLNKGLLLLFCFKNIVDYWINKIC